MKAGPDTFISSSLSRFSDDSLGDLPLFSLMICSDRKKNLIYCPQISYVYNKLYRSHARKGGRGGREGVIRREGY